MHFFSDKDKAETIKPVSGAIRVEGKGGFR